MTTRPRVAKALRPALGAWFFALSAYACSAPPPRVANPSRPLEERRAIEIIIEAFRQEQDSPVPGTPVAISADRALEVDVAAEGKKYGVAYVTGRERAQLGPALPPRDPSMGDALQLISGVGADGDARVLLLHDFDYVYDDHVGEAHEKSTIAAELKLRRDVRDFLVRAHSERWP